MPCSKTCWLLGGALFQCRYGGFWMSSCWLIFLGIRSFLVFSSFGFKPPASGFQSYSYSSLKTSPSIQVNGGKSLHSEGHPERITVLHGEENGNPLHYSCLENFTDRGAWWEQSHKELDMTEVTTQAHNLFQKLEEVCIIKLLLLSCFSRVRLCATP